EWDGKSKRAVIPWARLAVEHEAWASAHGRTSTAEALALRDRATDARIHVWYERPRGAPLVRRRLCASKIHALRKAIAEKGIALGTTPDWSRASDPARKRRTWLVVLGRLGYLLW